MNAAATQRTSRIATETSGDPRLLAREEIWNLATDAGDLDITTRPAGTDGHEDLLWALTTSRSPVPADRNLCCGILTRS
ncbi:MAG: hypothetical protein M3401_15610 [Actinomycetota bacterium]|nr:hypothetical protein [Actinomycetota bacterium]